MSRELFEEDIEAALKCMKSGGVILYPTDTVWGIGCDATNANAVQKIYKIKNRNDKKSLIILLADERDVLKYVAAPDPAVFDFIAEQDRPTTIIFENALGLPENVIAEDGSIAIRITRDEFCKHLVRRLQKPIVSTSSNRSGEKQANIFSEIDNYIKNNVDYIVKWRQDDSDSSMPSRIIKWNNDGSHIVIRE